MTDPITLTVAGFTFVLALAIAWRMRPRPPKLDGERWFKAWFATLLRGRVEGEGGTPERWGALVDRLALFHPAGRPVEARLAGVAAPGDPAESRAVVSALAALPDRSARWAYLFERDDVGRAARLGDPNDLGATYAPSRWLGPGLDWDAVARAAGEPSALVAALRRASSARWVLVPGAARGEPEVLQALAALLGERAVWHAERRATQVGLGAFRGAIAERRPGAPAHVEAAVALLEHLHDLTRAPSDRVVVVATGEAVHVALDALLTSDALRDQVDAVVAVGASIGGCPGADHPYDPGSCAAFLRAWFSHAALDLEAAHRCPWFALQWLDAAHAPPGAFGLPLELARFPDPADQGGPRDFVQPVDLGPLRPDPDLPVDLVALALWGVVTSWVRAQRP
jgi:hypothetical protein